MQWSGNMFRRSLLCGGLLKCLSCCKLPGQALRAIARQRKEASAQGNALPCNTP